MPAQWRSLALLIELKRTEVGRVCHFSKEHKAVCGIEVAAVLCRASPLGHAAVAVRQKQQPGDIAIDNDDGVEVNKG